ncbi:MAG: cupin domain-containing protein [Bacteroidota bacterium]
MRQPILFYVLWLCAIVFVPAQEPLESHETHILKISKTLLAGEGLDFKQQKEADRSVYQKKIYDGSSLALDIVAIGTGITNTFENFPMEEFIFWKNGKAIVTPESETPFEVHSGDYFIQAKGFKGTWHFVNNGGLHLELALIAKNRDRLPKKSPITKAMVINRDLISGVQDFTNDEMMVYSGAELQVKLIRSTQKIISGSSQDALMHVLQGVVTFTDDHNDEKQVFYPGDFFVLPEGFKGSWNSDSLQDLRMFEVLRMPDPQ